ncbi:glutamate-binding protein [Actinomadura sp. NBRC 104425]|uniref:transporter substrate-binding domain-containing protein n=1 Tax=Actinomadura sp. NBRC 104425 TaxID=3032204 RepID=UPI0024A4C689|nr:transporter substrate-binding domain-containing protein [Actinomadura sp. NBRC 104425]GLZ10673.1 glutamate-binding protein [Actinomadura sp. NBRC 104425]
MRLPTLIALPAALAAALLSACGSSRGESLLDKKTWVVGVRPDLPGLGLRRPDGTFEGFDIDVARYIARDLGRTVTFVPVLAADRIPVLETKRADLVLATLSVTPERKTSIAFAGPYLTSYQDVLVRADMKGVTGLRDLIGRRFCAVQGSDTTKRLLAVRGMTATLVPAKDYDRCMALIRSNGVDAITTNDVILAGLAKRAGGGVRLLGAQIAEQNSGIGIRRGDPDGCEALNGAITRMYQNGTAAKLLRKWFGGTGLDRRPIIEVPQFEGCL